MTFARIALAAVCLAALATPSSALPLPHADRTVLDEARVIVDAGWRCGPGWHMTPRGRCVRNR